MHLEAGAVIRASFDLAESASGIVANSGVIPEVTRRDIDFTRRPSADIALKGGCFDHAPGRETVEVPEDCAACVENADVMLDNVRTGGWRVC